MGWHGKSPFDNFLFSPLLETACTSKTEVASLLYKSANYCKQIVRRLTYMSVDEFFGGGGLSYSVIFDKFSTDCILCSCEYVSTVVETNKSAIVDVDV